jgi:hypothetical protein
VPGVTPPGDDGGTTRNRGRPDLDLERDGEPSEEEYAITGLGELFDSGIASGREALEESFGLDDDPNDRFML